MACGAVRTQNKEKRLCFYQIVKYPPRKETLRVSNRYDNVAEWLRRWIANPLNFVRAGSNPAVVEILLVVWFLGGRPQLSLVCTETNKAPDGMNFDWSRAGWCSEAPRAHLERAKRLRHWTFSYHRRISPMRIFLFFGGKYVIGCGALNFLWGRWWPNRYLSSRKFA